MTAYFRWNSWQLKYLPSIIYNFTLDKIYGIVTMTNVYKSHVLDVIYHPVFYSKPSLGDRILCPSSGGIHLGP
jgi:hypothetical protein